MEDPNQVKDLSITKLKVTESVIKMRIILIINQNKKMKTVDFRKSNKFWRQLKPKDKKIMIIYIERKNYLWKEINLLNLNH